MASKQERNPEDRGRIWQKIAIKDFETQPFRLIGTQWMLITARHPDGRVNTMTASWGGLGIMWNKPVALIVIRPSRYTKEMVDAAEIFSLSFLPAAYKKQLGYLGRVSGRDEDKIERSKLTLIDLDGAPAFAESELILTCRKAYRQVYDPAGFIDPSIAENYPQRDYHTLYLAEVITIRRRTES